VNLATVEATQFFAGKYFNYVKYLNKSTVIQSIFRCLSELFYTLLISTDGWFIVYKIKNLVKKWND